MNFIKKIFHSTSFWPLLIVLASAILAGRTLIFEKGYFNMHDDLQMMRQLEMQKCFLDGQIPCRWVPDMGDGYGFPLFNFYPPLPYYTGEIFKVLQFSYIDTAKLTFALSFILSGLTMYFLAKEFFGKWGGVVSSIFYVWAPYHSVDVYVRGAMDEAWALIWFPLILLTAYKLIQEDKKPIKWMIGLALSWAGLLLSHNLMVMIFTPVFAGWCLIFWIKKHDVKKFFQIFASGIFAMCLSAFFTLPAIIEQKLIHVDTLTQGYYTYFTHYATIGQLLFSRFWGYGPSIWGPNDGLSFQIGQIHWILSLGILGLIFFAFIKKWEISGYSLLAIGYSILFAWFAAFMTHQNSILIWQKIPILAFTQFPWRFLTLAIFGFSFAAGSIVVLLKDCKRLLLIVPALICVLLIVVNWNYFLPMGGKMGALTDVQKFSGVAWDLQKTAGIYDYLPLTANVNPKAPEGKLFDFVTGTGETINLYQGTDWAKFDVNVASTGALIRVNIFEFPTWKVSVDGKSVKEFIPKTEDWGRMYLNLPSGVHSVSLKLTNTPIRTIANIISALGWLVLLSCLLVLQFVRGTKRAS